MTSKEGVTYDSTCFIIHPVASLMGRGRTAPGDTLQGGHTRMKKMVGYIYKGQWRNEVGQVKKVRVTL